jgi:hypothetical protein
MSEANKFREIFLRLANVNRDDLEKIGAIPVGAHGDDKWTRFNRDLTTFVLKLNPEPLECLAALVTPAKES